MSSFWSSANLAQIPHLPHPAKDKKPMQPISRLRASKPIMTVDEAVAADRKYFDEHPDEDECDPANSCLGNSVRPSCQRSRKAFVISHTSPRCIGKAYELGAIGN